MAVDKELPFRPQAIGRKGTAKRKIVRAYVRLDPGQGCFIINGEPATTYFAKNTAWRKALDPFKVLGLDEKAFDIQAYMVGRAKRWRKRQPRALAHAIAGALTALAPTRHDQLWQAGFRFEVISALDWLRQLPVEAWLAVGVDPDELWAKHHALFLRPLPKKWAANPHVLTLGGRWLLDVLLVPLKDEDLNRVRDYLDEQGQSVSDVDILRELFDITSRDDDFDRQRFTLSYQLSQKAEELGVEFVGAGTAWTWALQTAPIEKPERHRRLPGTDGLPIEYVEVDQVAADLIRGDEPVEVPPEESQEEWKPTQQTWEYVLTYYDWDNGVLPYHRQTREMIPPLSEGQRRAVLCFVAEQVADEHFEVTLYAHSRVPWLQGMGLKDLFVGYLVPGARIWIDRTEEPGLYKVRYRPTEPWLRRLLFFEEDRVRPVIREHKIICEVDETMLLAEGRYSNIEALDRLDLADRRTAPKVLARVFELIGLKDESRGVYCAQFDDVFPLLCITKPYAKSYVKNILYNRQKYPWFYSDEERGVGWFVYDPEQERLVMKRRRQRTTEGAPEEIEDTTAPIKDLWAEFEAGEQRKAALQAAVQAYMADPAREKVLFLREVAHQRIRKLVAEDRLGALTLDDFNRQVWQIGSASYQGQSDRIDSEEATASLTKMSIEELKEAYESGELEIEGNQTWGSGSYKFGPQLSKSDIEKERIVQNTLRFLLFGEGSIEQQMKQVINEPNGFGINVVSGILHAVYPEEHVLYSRRSVDALKMLGISWPDNWRRKVDTYVAYRDFCQQLREHFGFQSLTDVDWFMYQLAIDRIELSVAELQQVEDLWEKYVLSLDPNEYIGWTVVHQRKLKGYYDLWAKYLKFMDEHPHVEEQVIRSATDIHWRGTMHPRYLGLLTEERVVTPAGREFYGMLDERDDMLHRQLQKWHYCVDSFCDPDPGYEVYPLFALLRILLSLPESDYTISIDELRYFVLATKNFEECDDRIALIRDFRENRGKWKSSLDGIFRHTYVGRMHHMLELSPYLSLSSADIGVKASYVTQAQHILTQYQELEQAELVPYYSKEPHRYLRMLRSTESIFDFCQHPR